MFECVSQPVNVIWFSQRERELEAFHPQICTKVWNVWNCPCCCFSGDWEEPESQFLPFLVLKHQDTLIFLPCPVFSTASFCKTNLPKNSPINTKFKYLCLFVSLLLCRLTEKWDDEFRGKRSRVPLCVSEMWRNVLQVWTYSHQTTTASLCLSSVYSI